MMIFRSRFEAGEQLAKKLVEYKGQNAVIYALPRGGVTVGYKIAKNLSLPLDIVLVKKIGHPFDPEYALCAISENEFLECNPDATVNIENDWLEKEKKSAVLTLRERREKYKKSSILAEGKIAILVDDGIATGLTMLAAIQEIKLQKPQKIVVAVPVAAKDIYENIKGKVDEFVAVDIPESFAGAVGAYYLDFPQVEDKEVINLIKEANANF